MEDINFPLKGMAGKSDKSFKILLKETKGEIK